MRKNTRSDNKYLEFWSKDDAYGLRMSDLNLSKMLEHCENSFPDETGGILIGSYTKSLDCAAVELVTGPPKDSKRGRTWFKRGVQGLRKLLGNYWKRNRFYVGEWHFHPNGEPSPSDTDKNQLKAICKSRDYDCSAPVLVIVGGKLPEDWNIRAFVSPRDGDFQELLICDNKTTVGNFL